MKNYLVLFLMSTIFVLGCRCKPRNVAGQRNTVSLRGYWIPQKIRWGGDGTGNSDTGDIFRIAAFKTLCFEDDNKFIYFVSTQRRPRNYNDSIIFAGEPAFNVFGGNWQSVNDTVLRVDYSPIEYNIKPPDRKDRYEEIKIFLQEDTLLLFQNELYHRTHKYDNISQRIIEGYKNHYRN